MIETIVETVVTFVREHESWAAPIAFLVAFGESFCFFSLLLPGTAILVGVAGLLAASGVESHILMPAIIAAALGGSLGYATSYWIGRYFKDSIPNIWPFTTHPHLIEQGERFFEKYGAFGVFLGHFFGPVRAVIPVVAGMFAMRQLPFQIANVASAIIWSAGVIAPSFYVVTFKSEIMAFIAAHEILVAVVLAVLAFAATIPNALIYGPALLLFMGVGAVLILTHGDILLVWFAGATGAALGDLFAYIAGKHPSKLRAGSSLMSAAPEDHADARALIARRGLASLVISKLQGVSRGLVPFEFGAGSEAKGTGSAASFTAVSIVSALIWSALYLLPAIVARALMA
jgi:membrane protein DedA with SNARE-associated domain